MASPGVVCTTVTPTSSAGSDQVVAGDGEAARRPVAPAVMEERKRKRKESNRLSAQRSRARKQQQLDELAGQVAALRARNGALGLAAREAARRCAAVRAENELLRARSVELAARLDSLTDLAQCLHDAAAASSFAAAPPMMMAGAATAFPTGAVGAAAGFMMPQLPPPLLDATTMGMHCNYYY
uniref:BZIP domain-containing protein n=1 Tax=Oryza rufipogon TaxID=4529 RepID=A0A0E0MXR0_ORYRU